MAARSSGVGIEEFVEVLGVGCSSASGVDMVCVGQDDERDSIQFQQFQTPTDQHATVNQMW